MAWENLDEDIAEEFSDNRRLGRFDSGFSFIRRKGRPDPCPNAAQTRREKANARRRARRTAVQFSRLQRGERPVSCQACGCYNLLPIIPLGGGHQRFCSERCCKKSKWVRLKRAQRARRRAAAYASGARPTVCTAPGCSNRLPPARTKIPLYCSEKCGARVRRQRARSTPGAAGTAGQ